MDGLIHAEQSGMTERPLGVMTLTMLTTRDMDTPNERTTTHGHKVTPSPGSFCALFRPYLDGLVISLDDTRLAGFFWLSLR